MQRPGVISVLSALLLALAALLPWQAASAQAFPKLAGRVTDAANIIPADVEARIDGKLAALETQSRRQLVVATITSLEGYDIADYGYRLGREWGIGDKQRNDGVLLIVAPNERKLRVEVGYGMEGIVTDGLSSLIINQTIVPRFKAGDMPGGIEAGADALITQMTLPEDQARLVAAQANQPPEAQISIGTIIFIFFILFFFVLPIIRSVRSGGRSYRGGSGPIVWLPSGGSSWGSSSGGGGFGGGFSGGGGSFGGGGSSGSW